MDKEARPQRRVKITADGTKIMTFDPPITMYPDPHFTIISIDDSRAHYKDQIRHRVLGSEVVVPATNGNEVDLREELDKREIVYEGGWLTRGEIGVFLSTFDCWQWAVDNDKPLIVFEDDAIPVNHFTGPFSELAQELPDDWGFLSLWVPKNQFPDYFYDVEYDERGNWVKVGNDKMAATSNYNFGSIRLARAYQGYGNVAMYYSPSGAAKLIEQARTAISDPVDCFIYIQAHTGKVNGYAPKPHWARVVDYDWEAPTTVHNTERFDNGS